MNYVDYPTYNPNLKFRRYFNGSCAIIEGDGTYPNKHAVVLMPEDRTRAFFHPPGRSFLEDYDAPGPHPSPASETFMGNPDYTDYKIDGGDKAFRLYDDGSANIVEDNRTIGTVSGYFRAAPERDPYAEAEALVHGVTKAAEGSFTGGPDNGKVPVDAPGVKGSPGACGEPDCDMCEAIDDEACTDCLIENVRFEANKLIEALLVLIEAKAISADVAGALLPRISDLSDALDKLDE